MEDLNDQESQYSMEQTRIIVKGIPKFVKEDQLAERFSSAGNMTDCKILKTVQGKSRGFAFVGYKTHEEALKAIEQFNGTFFNTSKITVEFAKPIGDQSLDECYARIKKNPKQPKKKPQEEEDQQTQQPDKPPHYSLENDPEYLEFMAARQAKNLRPSWNDGLVQYLEEHETAIHKEKEQKEKKQSQNIQNVDEEEEDKEEQNDAERPDVLPETTRIFVTNVPYDANEESIENFFSKYGKVLDVQLPFDSIVHRHTGRAYVTFATYDAVISALKDSIIFEGRHLHLEPAEKSPYQNTQNDFYDDDEAYASKKRREMKVEKPESWNALFLNKDTVAEYTARKLGVTKAQILNPESDDIASRLAIAESQLVSETREMFQKAGIDLSLFDKGKETKLSKTLLIVKNLKYETTEEELRNKFEAYGLLIRFIFPPTHAVALIEFARPEDAKKAHQGLSFSKIHDQPMYIQWAPAQQAPSYHPVDENDEEGESARSTPNQKQIKTTTLIMKNVPFKATRKEIYDLVNTYAKLKAVRMPEKADRSGHRGFCFLDFNTRQEATTALTRLADVHLYDRHLVVQPADVGRNADSMVQKDTE